MEKLIMNKNRGWRGLAEACLYDNSDTKDLIQKQIFSFSQDMWDDLICRHLFVIDTGHTYKVIQIADPDYRLPKPTQQRSVLIKNAVLDVITTWVYDKKDWNITAKHEIYRAIQHFIVNRNNHTQSDWNCIGIRVIPVI